MPTNAVRSQFSLSTFDFSCFLELHPLFYCTISFLTRQITTGLIGLNVCCKLSEQIELCVNSLSGLIKLEFKLNYSINSKSTTPTTMNFCKTLTSLQITNLNYLYNQLSIQPTDLYKIDLSLWFSLWLFLFFWNCFLYCLLLRKFVF